MKEYRCIKCEGHDVELHGLECEKNKRFMIIMEFCGDMVVISPLYDFKLNELYWEELDLNIKNQYPYLKSQEGVKKDE